MSCLWCKSTGGCARCRGGWWSFVSTSSAPSDGVEADVKRTMAQLTDDGRSVADVYADLAKVDDLTATADVIDFAAERRRRRAQG